MLNATEEMELAGLRRSCHGGDCATYFYLKDVQVGYDGVSNSIVAHSCPLGL